MKYTIKKTFAISSIGLLLSLSLAPLALADDQPANVVEVTGNGADSQNNISVSSNNSTNVQSTNNANITNNVNTTANTGNNSADFNTGGNTTVNTGDVNTSTSISNEANKSVVDANNCNCQSSGTTAIISGNGAFSENNISANNSNNTSVDVNNNARITNNVTTHANTGYNSADFNTGGNTVIKTGKITALTELLNSPVNIAKVKVSGHNSNNDLLLKIVGNGAFSENNIDADNNDNIDITVNNVADLVNNVKNYLNTGHNSADFNTGGDVVIKTGDIFAETVIKNLANISIVEVVCGCEKENPKPNEQPQQPSAPTTSTTSVGGVSSSSSSSPEVVAAAILPVTGNNILFFLLLANILMFFLGTYLRLRSGRSPTYSISL